MGFRWKTGEKIGVKDMKEQSLFIRNSFNDR